MWAYRRMLRISYTEHRTNVSILKKLKVTTRLSTRKNQSYLRYFGHISRRTNGLEKLIVEGKINGKQPRGRSPTRWVDQTKGIIGHGLQEASLATEKQNIFQQIFHDYTDKQIFALILSKYGSCNAWFSVIFTLVVS